jgi:hypothetical protein
LKSSRDEDIKKSEDENAMEFEGGENEESKGSSKKQDEDIQLEDINLNLVG